jgi:phage I-like protein
MLCQYSIRWQKELQDYDGLYMKNVFALFSKPKQKEITMKPELVRLTEISSAVARGITALKALIAECEAHKIEIAALKAKAVDDQAQIDALTAALEAAIPDAGGSTGGVSG